MSTEPKTLLIVPGEGRWIWRADQLCFYFFGANGPAYSFLTTAKKRHKAVLRAAEFEVLRQKGEL